MSQQSVQESTGTTVLTLAANIFVIFLKGVEESVGLKWPEVKL